MKPKRTKILSLALIALFALSACTPTPTTISRTDIPATTAATDSVSSDANSPTTETSQTSTNTSPTGESVSSEIDLLETHEAEGDYTWDDSKVVEVALADGASSASSQSVKISGNQVTITAGGTYRLTGKLSDGQVFVESADDTVVQLILNGVEIHSNTSAPIYIKTAEKTIVILADGTENILTDTSNYVFASADEDEPKATLFSNDDLTIYGAGMLTIVGRWHPRQGLPGDRRYTPEGGLWRGRFEIG